MGWGWADGDEGAREDALEEWGYGGDGVRGAGDGDEQLTGLGDGRGAEDGGGEVDCE